MKEEGTRLVHLSPIDKELCLQDSFTGYVMMYTECHNFTPSMDTLKLYINLMILEEPFTR